MTFLFKSENNFMGTNRFGLKKRSTFCVVQTQQRGMRVLRRDDYELDAADSGDESSQGSCLRFRQFFESHFEALDRPSSPTKNTTAENDNDSFDSDQEECEGVSNVDLHKPIFIDHGTTAALTAQITQSGRRSFMVYPNFRSRSIQNLG